MSSLLDILHGKDSRDREEDATEAAAATTVQTVELRLAIDNGPAEPGIDLSASTAETPAIVIPEAQAAPPAGTDPFATYAGSNAAAAPATDATRVLMARQLQRRSRQSAVLLGTGLAVIVVGAGLATWLVNETSGLATSDSALFSAPVDGAAETPAATTGPVQRPATEAVAVEAAASRGVPDARPVTTRPAPDLAPVDTGTDTAWFDIPATGKPVADAGEDPAEPIRITRGTTTNPLFAKLTEAWTAFQAADFVRAEALYREVRAGDPANVDALLGLGALAARGNRTAEAREFYQAVLAAEPRNAAALSAMSTLPAAGTRNLDESALKSLLREQPGAANLHFALGLHYVGLGRWPDAQTAFFEAVRNDPANADYAYNLAVSLDQLAQSGPAAAYYQRALELATASSLFNPGAAAERLASLRSATP